jgi:hypothetical protein
LSFRLQERKALNLVKPLDGAQRPGADPFKGLNRSGDFLYLKTCKTYEVNSESRQ